LSKDWIISSTWLVITFAVSKVNQFLNALCNSCWDVVMRILWYIKNAPSYRYGEKGDAKIICYSDVDCVGSLGGPLMVILFSLKKIWSYGEETKYNC